MIEYELINPSDPYTFVAADKEVAALVVALLSTAYAAETKERNEENEIPCFLFGGFKEWYQEEFGRGTDDGLDARKKEVGEALESFMYGHFIERAKYNAALKAVDDPEKKKIFIFEWNDQRSSLNDIGGYAHQIGEKLLKEANP